MYPTDGLKGHHANSPEQRPGYNHLFCPVNVIVMVLVKNSVTFPQKVGEFLPKSR